MKTKPVPTSPDLVFQEALQRLMRYARDNRKELACELDVHLSTLSRWLNGRTQPSLSDQELVFSLLKQREEESLRMLIRKYGEASPGLRLAVAALLERGLEAWDTFDAITRDELLRLFLEIDGE